jgi:hypothetical protein
MAKPLCPDCAFRGSCRTADLDRNHDFDFAHCKMFERPSDRNHDYDFGHCKLFERRPAPSDRDREWRADAVRKLRDHPPPEVSDEVLYAQRVIVLLDEKEGAR